MQNQQAPTCNIKLPASDSTHSSFSQQFRSSFGVVQTRKGEAGGVPSSSAHESALRGLSNGLAMALEVSNLAA